MLRMALLPLMVLQSWFEEVVYTLPSLLSKTCQATASLLKEGLEVRRNDMDLPGAPQVDLQDVMAVDLQLSEHPLVGVQVLLPSIQKIPAEGLVLHHLQLLQTAQHRMQGTRKPGAVGKVLALAEEAGTVVAIQLVLSIIA